MAKNTSILLGDHFENFVNLKIDSGRYSSVSEVLRAGLRLLEIEEMKIQELKKALIEGEKSGKPKKMKFAEFKKKLNKKYTNRA